MVDANLCPCGSGIRQENCCLQYYSGEANAPTAEALMRSRYTAYVMGNEAYLLATWHENNRPERLNLQQSNIIWQGLEVIRTQAGKKNDKQGLVEFRAHYLESGKKAVIHEASRFVKIEGSWFYVDGDLITSNKVPRNAPCPCGSGKKYKRCCGQS